MEFLASLTNYLPTVVLITYGIVFSFFLWYQIRNYTFQLKKLKDTIISGLVSNTIKDIEELKYVYSGVYKRGFTSKSIGNLSMILKEIFADFIQQPESADVRAKISKFIKEIDDVSPYAELPELERNSLTDIHIQIKDLNAPHAESKLRELSKIMLSRFQELEKTKKVNKYALIVGVAGLVLTIVFGIAPLLKS